MSLTGIEIFGICCAVAAPLSVYLVAVFSGRNELEHDEDLDGPSTIIIMPPTDEVEKVDIRKFYQRWE